ncbi:hypothetical protein [Micromonospora sp. NPDC049679]|uniref:hypothetical protein n=1 Tax=Micromonospora sp. NPDC049679 TaxID=3155920 RepID=UPI0033C258FE
MTASAADVTAAYAGHRGMAMTQSLLVHGVAALALAVVALALADVAARNRAQRWGRVAAAGGLGAAALSLAQFALGQALAAWAVPTGRTGAAGLLFDLVNRIDGVKMFALAVMAAAGVAVARRTRVLPGWLGYVGAVLAVALTGAGVGYLLVSTALTPVAYVALPLLLVWVTGTGLSLARARR